MIIINLASGSNGNCTYVESANTHILIDVGVSFDELKQKLASVGKDVQKLEGVLITHEHFDHIKGLQTLIKKCPTIQIFAHPRTMAKLTQKIFIPLGNQNNIYQGDFFVGDFAVSAFSLSHDASYCLGYSIFENGKKFSIATDVGYLTDDLINNLQGSNLVFVESNYDQTMLYYCEKYPFILKKRISSKFGHLSNDDCSLLVEKLVDDGVQNFALAHISENSNTYELALQTTVDYLTAKGKLSNNISIDVLLQYQISKIFEI